MDINRSKCLLKSAGQAPSACQCEEGYYLDDVHWNCRPVHLSTSDAQLLTPSCLAYQQWNGFEYILSTLFTGENLSSLCICTTSRNDLSKWRGVLGLPINSKSCSADFPGVLSAYLCFLSSQSYLIDWFYFMCFVVYRFIGKWSNCNLYNE